MSPLNATRQSSAGVAKASQGRGIVRYYYYLVLSLLWGIFNLSCAFNLHGLFVSADAGDQKAALRGVNEGHSVQLSTEAFVDGDDPHSDQIIPPPAGSCETELVKGSNETKLEEESSGALGGELRGIQATWEAGSSKALPKRRLSASLAFGVALTSLGALALTELKFVTLENAVARLKNALTRKPMSWRMWVWGLKVVDERQHPDFMAVVRGLGGDSHTALHAARGASEEKEPRRTYVHIVAAPSDDLAAFLELSVEQKSKGLAIKGRSPQYDGLEVAGSEAYMHSKFVAKNRFFLPILQVLRSRLTGNIYTIHPRACCDLSQYYRTSPKTVNVKLATAEMVHSVALFHRTGFYHRDIKPMNFFVSQEGHIVLSDFEMMWPVWLNCRYDEAPHTVGFRAPELKTLVGGFVPFSEKSEVFALGMAMARLFLGVRRVQRTPFEGKLVSVILKMIDSNPAKRLTLKEVQNDPYFEDINWETVEKMEYGIPFSAAKTVMARFDSYHS